MKNPTREAISANIRASEAGTETKIARLDGKIDTISATIIGKIDSLSEKIVLADQYNRGTRWMLFGTFATGFVALAAVLVALASYGDALFSRGMSVRDVVQAVIKEQQGSQARRERAGGHPARTGQQAALTRFLQLCPVPTLPA